MGFLPEAMRNYLLRLGWGHGDDEIIADDEAIAWFDLDAVGRSPARFDLAKLTSLNAHYLRERPDAELVQLIAPASASARARAGRRGRASAAGAAWTGSSSVRARWSTSPSRRRSTSGRGRSRSTRRRRAAG